MINANFTQLSIIVIPTERESWLHSVVPDRVSRMIADEENSGNSGRATNFLDSYTDRVQEEVSDDENESGPRRAIEGGAQQVKNTSPGVNADEDENAVHENAWSRN
jgi:hypothetical protein